MTKLDAIDIFLSSAVIFTVLPFAVKSPNRVRNGKIAGITLGVCTLVSVIALIAIS